MSADKQPCILTGEIREESKASYEELKAIFDGGVKVEFPYINPYPIENVKNYLAGKEENKKENLKNKNLKKLLLIILLGLTLQTFSQDIIKVKSVASSYRVISNSIWGPWSEWKSVNIIMTITDYKIEIFSATPQTLDVLYGKEDTYDYKGNQVHVIRPLLVLI